MNYKPGVKFDDLGRSEREDGRILSPDDLLTYRYLESDVTCENPTEGSEGASQIICYNKPGKTQETRLSLSGHAAKLEILHFSLSGK